MLNPICTFWTSGRKLGAICSSPVGEKTIYAFILDKGNDRRIDMQPLENKVIDEPLKSLSSNRYAVITDKVLLLDHKLYQGSGSIPIQCQWIAMPVLSEGDIVAYTGGNAVLDEVFLAEGYARELASAYCVFIPPTWEIGSCTPLDFLIREVKDNVPITFSGRTLKDVVPRKVEGKYIFLEKVPEIMGKAADVPYTYTIGTLAAKYWVLQSRLQAYGSSRIGSICTSLSSIIESIREAPNQFRASQCYDSVVSMTEKIKDSL